MAGKVFLSESDWINGVLMRPVEFEVPGLGWVEVRGMSSLELDELQTKFKDRPVMMMLGAVERCMVTPKLSEAGVKALHEGNAKYAEMIANRILELSGQGDKKQQDPLAGNG